MISTHTPRLSTVLLVVLNAGLLALIIFVWRSGQERVQEPQHLAAHSLALPDLAVLKPSAIPTVDIAAIRDQTVFHNRRAFYRPPAPSQLVSPPDFLFAGTVMLPQGKRIAFVKRKADQSSRTLHVGDELDGWQVQLIDSVKVLLVRDDQRYELKTTNPEPTAGLIHGDTSPRVAQAGLRVLGATAQQARPLSTASPGAARMYTPPTP